MPRLKSAIKRVRTSERNRVRNLTYTTQIKTLIKKVNQLVLQKDSKSATSAANEAFALIDRATAKKMLHLNNASKKKSKISKWLKTLESSPSKSSTAKP